MRCSYTLAIFRLLASIYFAISYVQPFQKYFSPLTIKRSSLFMVSVGGGSPPSPPKRRSSFIISPVSTNTEMEILDNFSEIQQGEIKKIGIIGTQDLSKKHRQMIELLTYALVLSGNHVVTSGGGNGTNIAVIKGALRACNTDLLTVILPQSISKQPVEMQPLLLRVANLLENPQYDNLDLKEAANICNSKILSMVDEVLVFAYHSSYTILNSVDSIKGKMEVTTFYLD
mmetsp:Transcript_27891/g.28167  ORF Transcript_27891/g.28167 Transcript_27891/m.28167 type:complete len:229 (-) Transcript_27891:103-789(-)